MDFSEVNNRMGTYSTKWDFARDRFGRDDVLPFSISDTDFKIPVEVQNRLKQLVEKGIFGYTRWNHDAFFDALKFYFQSRHQTDISQLQFLYSPSVMYSVSILIRELSQPKQKIAVFSPMYDAFYRVIEENDRELLEIPLVKNKEGYQIDFIDFEKKISEASLFLLCSPHNPTGRVWTERELSEIVKLCQKYRIPIISDEIHSDVVLFKNRHRPIFSVEGDANIYLVSSSSKTFNTASLIGSYVLLNNKKVYDSFLNETRNKNFLNSASLLGMEAMIVGYRESEAYIDELVTYVEGNFEYLTKRLNEASSKISFTIPEATYLAWIDISQLGLREDEVQDLLINVGKVGIMSGKHYGDDNYIRMNIGCPRSKLEEGINRLELALEDYL